MRIQMWILKISFYSLKGLNLNESLETLVFIDAGLNERLNNMLLVFKGKTVKHTLLTGRNQF